METKALPLEVDDLSMEKGTATIAHSVYDTIDRVRDIASKGMFTKSWNEKKMAPAEYDIAFYINHDEDRAPGRVIGVHETEKKAYTAVKFGSHAEGQDALKMMDEKIIRNASFGFYTLKAKNMEVKDTGRVRKLLEVNHLETSGLTKLGAHPKAGVEKVIKAYTGPIIDIKSLAPDEQEYINDLIGQHSDTIASLAKFAAKLPPTSDIYTSAQYWLGRLNDMVSDMKSTMKWNGVFSDKADKKDLESDAETKDINERIENITKFIRNTTASDSAIQEMEVELKYLKDRLVVNTAATQVAPEPDVSEAELKSFSEELLLLSFKHL